jgi:hypothetical protein
VFNPTTLIAVDGLTVSDHLARAGGATRYAEEDDIYIIRADGSIVSRQQPSANDTHSNWFTRGWRGNGFLDLELRSGDTLVVPKKLDKIAWMREIKDITQILANVALSAGVVVAAGL